MAERAVRVKGERVEGDLRRYGAPAWDKEELGYPRLKPVEFTSAFIW